MHIRACLTASKNLSEVAGVESRFLAIPDPIGFQFIDQLARFMEECSRDKPCVLVLNNLHWADDPTVALLQRLVERVRHEDSGSRLLIVLTMRDDDHRSKPLLEFLEDNSEARSLDELNLKRFGRPQIAELIQHVLQIDAVPSTFLDRLEERTAGNPLFIVGMLKVLQEEGIIHRDSRAGAFVAVENSQGWDCRWGFTRYCIVVFGFSMEEHEAC